MPDDMTPFDPATTGWKRMQPDGYPGLIGPFWFKRDADGGGFRYGFTAEARHLNLGGVVHGGMLMSFADDVLGMTVWEAAGRKPCTTVQLSTQFIAPVKLGDYVVGRAEVLRTTRSVVFVRGLVSVGDRTIVHADGIWKILGA
ncbi:PaaI family thioesterase [Paeniroseomonas aquatica]|uniref:PaaI family thioesterase n=1 Tax=Paeniroseomonas aquatica TaxID=373043 RepID=A0ABT8A4L9_9PROT|nr:PaaI family thioesterase [Paeniroseomonas aquatica]MDN3564655.1 PaaI family thioesterase [Paeniroseomonas aquatica]